MKEHGNIFISKSDTVPWGQFVLAKTDTSVQKGVEIKNNQLSIVYASADASLADRLMVLGVARREMRHGDVLLVFNPGQETQF